MKDNAFHEILEKYFPNELVSLSFPDRKKLTEQRPNKKNPVDQDLENTADGIASNDEPQPGMAGGTDQMNPNADPMMNPEGGMGQDMGNVPDGIDMENGEGEDELPDEELEKPADPALLSRLSGHDYVKNYDHAESNSESHPNVILSMDVSELKDYFERVRGFLSKVSLDGTPGAYSDEETKTATDLASFIEKTLKIKQQEAQDQEKKSQKRPSNKVPRRAKYNTQQRSKAKAGQFRQRARS